MTELYDWHIIDRAGKKAMVGIVFGHKSLSDGTWIYTSEIQQIKSVDMETLEISTHNTVYTCKLSDCNYKNMEEAKTESTIPNFSKYKKKYSRRSDCRLDDNSALLLLSDTRHYYFDSLLVRYPGESRKTILDSNIHIGTFQDSVIIMDDTRLDIRYFNKLFNTVEFYSTETNGMQLYVKNIGKDTMDIYNSYDTSRHYLIKPGKSKKIVFNVSNMEEMI